MSFVKHFNYCTLECKESSSRFFPVDFKSLLVFAACGAPFSTLECFKSLSNLGGLSLSTACGCDILFFVSLFLAVQGDFR